MCVPVYICMSTCLYVCLNMHVSVCLFRYVCLFVYICVCLYMCLCLCLYVCLHVCFASMCKSVCVCVVYLFVCVSCFLSLFFNKGCVYQVNWEQPMWRAHLPHDYSIPRTKFALMTPHHHTLVIMSWPAANTETETALSRWVSAGHCSRVPGDHKWPTPPTYFLDLPNVYSLSCPHLLSDHPELRGSLHLL